jgi:hypothetical protein
MEISKKRLREKEENRVHGFCFLNYFYLINIHAGKVTGKPSHKYFPIQHQIEWETTKSERG